MNELDGLSPTHRSEPINTRTAYDFARFEPDESDYMDEIIEEIAEEMARDYSYDRRSVELAYPRQDLREDVPHVEPVRSDISIKNSRVKSDKIPIISSIDKSGEYNIETIITDIQSIDKTIFELTMELEHYECWGGKEPIDKLAWKISSHSSNKIIGLGWLFDPGLASNSVCVNIVASTKHNNKSTLNVLESMYYRMEEYAKTKGFVEMEVVILGTGEEEIPIIPWFYNKSFRSTFFDVKKMESLDLNLDETIDEACEGPIIMYKSLKISQQIKLG